jgi:hypothetical protein
LIYSGDWCLFIKAMSKSPTFNWVEARSQCSLALEFAALRKAAEADVALRNKQLGEDVGLQLMPVNIHPFSVRRHERGQNEVLVMFSIETDHILVEDQARKSKFKLTVTLNSEGECRFRIDGQGEFERWQVLLKALEGIFFEGLPKVETR